jgi:hypothetical protein
MSLRTYETVERKSVMKMLMMRMMDANNGLSISWTFPQSYRVPERTHEYEIINFEAMRLQGQII